MGYADENMQRGERIIYRTSLHWVIFLESFSILIMGLIISYAGVRYESFLGSARDLVEWISLAVLAFGGLKFILEFIRLRSSEFVVTTDRVLIKVGVIQQTSTTMPLSKIESIEVDQSILGRVLGYGSLNITGTGTAESKFDLITNPLKFRRKMQLASGDDSDEVLDREIDSSSSARRRRRRRRR